MLHVTSSDHYKPRHRPTCVSILRDCPAVIVLSFTHSLTAARNRLWVVAPSMLSGRRRVPMRLQQ